VKTSVAAVEDFTVKIAWPDPSVVPWVVVMVGLPEPELLASVTVLPDTGLLWASFNVTVIVEVVLPSAATVVGEAATADCAAVTAPAVNVTVAVCVTVTVSVVSVAWKTSAAAVVDATVKVAWPEASVVPDVVAMVGVPEPEVLASVTVLPETGWLLASFNVTVIVEVVLPSAVTDEGEAATADCAAVTGPTVNVTVAVAVTVTLSAVSVAVKTSAATVPDLTVNNAWPELSVVPWVVVMVGLPEPEVWASVTVLPETGLLWASFNVTVIVEVVLPSATTDVGEADTADCAAVTAPAVNVTVAVAVIVTVSVVSVAWKTSAAAVVDATVKVA